MKKIKKENIKPFICGCISTLVIIGLIFGGYKLFTSIKKDKDNKSTNKQVETKLKQGYITLEINERKKNVQDEKVCTALKDALLFGDSTSSTFVTKDGKLYYMNNKKYSDTNENCKEIEEGVKVRALYNSYYILEDNSVVYIQGGNDYGEGNGDVKLKPNTDSYDGVPDYFLSNNDIVKVNQFGYKNDDDVYHYQYLTLKKDGKLYLDYIDRKYISAGYYNYEFIKEEEYKSFDKEKIIDYTINSRGTNTGGSEGFVSWIVTDKNIYFRYITNKECREYADIECKYDYQTNKELNKYIKDLIRISVYEEDWIEIETKDFYVDVYIKYDEK